MEKEPFAKNRCSRLHKLALGICWTLLDWLCASIERAEHS